MYYCEGCGKQYAKRIKACLECGYSEFKEMNSEDLQEFEVGFWYTEHGTIKVDADNEDNAHEIVRALLYYKGLDDLPYRYTDRDYGTA